MKLLETFPVPSLILNAGNENIRDLVKKESKGHFGNEFVSDLVRISAESVGIPDKDGIFALKIKMEIDRIRGIKRDINTVESNIRKRVADDEDVKHLDDIPGIDTVRAATIMAEIGNIDQFESAMKLQSYGGVTLSDNGSADSYISRHSRVSNHYLATAASRSAVTLVLHNTREFKNVYDREMGKQKRVIQTYITV
jgi:transposase